MSAHVPVALEAYVADTLSERQRREIEDHLVGCAECRLRTAEMTELRAVLGDVPPEAFLDGPPEDDLVLHRALRQVRTQRRTGTRNRSMFGSAAALAVVVALGGGVLLGKLSMTTGPTRTVALPVTTISDAMHLHGTADGARLSVTVIPGAGEVRMNGWAIGIPAGRCRLVLATESGHTEVVAGWLVSRHAGTDGMAFDVVAVAEASQVRSVELQNMSGRTFVSASH